MYIGVVSTTIFPVPLAGYGGLEHLAWLRARGLAAKGHKVFLVAPEGSHCEGCEIVSTGPPGQVHEAHAFHGYKQRLLDCDVVIDESWHKFSYMMKTSGWLKAPVLGVLHAPVNTMLQSLPPNVEKPCFVCISQDQADHFNALFCPAEARVCYNGVDPDFYKPLDIPRTDRFLFLARFSSIKGPDLAIKACKEAGVGLDLIGDTKLTGEPEYLNSILHMADGKQIRFVGPANRGECVHWFSQAYCLLHPNQRFREPFGLAPVESMLCGAPVIAWDYGAMRETVGPAVSGGSLVKSFGQLVDAVREFSQKSALVNQMRVGSREWATTFSVDRMIDRTEELCQLAIETGGW